MKKIILASASPRRKELLQQIGVPFEIEVSNVDETINLSITPQEMVQELSRKKALSVAENQGSNTIVIGADTIVVYKDKILGKPADEQEAKQMLMILQGNKHEVYTGVTIIDKSVDKQDVQSFTTKTQVYMKNLTEKEVEAYICTGEPMDKAGAYAVQGKSAVFIDRIEGDYTTVVGLPVAKVYDMLNKKIDFMQLWK